VDLSSLVLPDPRLARRFSLSADDWSGFPNNRNALLDALSNVQGLVALTGDSHSFFASGLGLTNGKSVVEFVCGAVSSTTYRAALETGGDMAGVAALAPIAGALIQSGNPGVAFQNVEDNGFALVVAGSAALQVTFYQVPHARLAKPFVESAAEPDGLALLFEEITFRVRSGSSVIERKTDDGFERWDPEAQRWI
jgi:phosphodiesterase/alkaline phosphatase D-like protein